MLSKQIKSLYMNTKSDKRIENVQTLEENIEGIFGKVNELAETRLDTWNAL